MSRVLVVGDSFMRPDVNYPKRHFTEHLDGYQVVCRAQDSSSNAMIAMQLFDALDQDLDAVILGFTMMDRLEFDAEHYMKAKGWKWYSNGCIPAFRSDYRTTVDHYRATTSHDMMFIRSLLIARACFMTLVQRKIPFVYTLNGLWQHEQNNRADLEHQLIGEFRQHELDINLSRYPKLKFPDPSYHVDDDEWQQGFARHCLVMLDHQRFDSTGKML